MAGLLLGGEMKPQLAIDDQPAGPQTVAARSGVRAARPADDGPSYANYSGAIPSYVVGTDWQTPAKLLDAPPPPPIENYYVSPIADDDTPQAGPADPRPAEFRPTEFRADAHDVTPATYGAPAERLAYPSLDGGAAAEAADEASVSR